MVVVICRYFLCLFLALGEGASGGFGHELGHSCAGTWITMTMVCACVRSDLYVMLSGGFSLKDTI